MNSLVPAIFAAMNQTRLSEGHSCLGKSLLKHLPIDTWDCDEITNCFQ